MVQTVKCRCCNPPWAWVVPRVQTTEDCTDCVAGMSRCWEIAVAGITASGDGSNCENYNGTFVLVHETTCTFRTAVFPGIRFARCENEPANPPDAGSWVMGFGAGGWQLNAAAAGGGSLNTYRLDSGNPCLDDDLVFARAVDACCGNWPSTITAIPVLCT